MFGKKKKQTKAGAHIDIPAPLPPRILSEIEAEAAQKFNQLGQAEYTVRMQQEQVNILTHDLRKLNNEAYERKQLDLKLQQQAQDLSKSTTNLGEPANA